ncbi:MAG: amidohydrolase family protein [Phycisphaerales bacterium]
MNTMKYVGMFAGRCGQAMRGVLRRSRGLGTLGVLASAMVGAAGASLRAADDVLAFRVGKVVTMDSKDTVVNNAVVIVRGGKIESVHRAREAKIPADARTIEMDECWLVPGLIDCHNHTGGSLRDLNDMVYLTNPGLRTLDTVVPESDDVKRARMGGVTSALLIPGSGTNMSGFGTIVKFAGDTVDEMVMKSPGSLKIAQAGNPERYWYGVGRSMMNYNTRQTLQRALDYHRAWEAYEKGQTTQKPEYNPIFEDFRGLFRQEYIASMHTQIYQVVMTSIDMMARKFKVRTVLDHSTFDGWKNARNVLDVGEDMVKTICGPRAFFLDSTQRRMNGIAARWHQGGVKQIGINTDAPVIPEEELPYQAAMNCWFGFQPYLALKAVTSVPASALMIEKRVGSIEPGKDADFGVWTGDPIDPRSQCKITVINGKIVSDGREGQRW